MPSQGWKQTIAVIIVSWMLLTSLLACGGTVAVQTKSRKQFPAPVGRVSDFAHLLSQEEIAVLTNKAAELEERTTIQLAVVTVDTIQPYEKIDPYATNLFNEWGIGQKDKNNGLLLLVALKERQVRIEVGLGLEATLPDAQCKAILRNSVTPYLARREFFQALSNGTEAVVQAVAPR